MEKCFAAQKKLQLRQSALQHKKNCSYGKTAAAAKTTATEKTMLQWQGGAALPNH